MEIRLIRTEADYKASLAEVERLFDAEPGTPEFDRLDVLATLIEAYEAKGFPVDPPDAVGTAEHKPIRLVLTPDDTEDRTVEVIAERLRVGRKLSHLYLSFWQECPSATGGYTTRVRDADFSVGFDEAALKHIYDGTNRVFTTLIFIDALRTIRLLHGGEFPPDWGTAQAGWELTVRFWFLRS